MYKRLKEIIKEATEEALEEANAVGAGQIVGSQSPLAMDMNPSHKLMWKGTNPKKAIKNSSNIKENITITKPNTIEEAVVSYDLVEQISIELLVLLDYANR